MQNNLIENLRAATENLEVVQNKREVAFPTFQQSSVRQKVTFVAILSITWISLLLEFSWLYFQQSTAYEGARDAEKAIMSNEYFHNFYVRRVTNGSMWIAALGDLYTNVWGVSPKYDTNRLLYDSSDLHDVADHVLLTSMKFLFYVSATPSFAIGAAANWLGVQPLISSDKNSDAVYFERNAPLFVLCLAAGMVYYFANARFGFSKTIETVQKYFYPKDVAGNEMRYPSSTHRQFIYGGYLRAFFAFSESFRTVIVRSLSFLALFDLLYKALRCEWPDEVKYTVRAVVFLTTAVAVALSRLVKVVTHWINQDYAKLSDNSKLRVAQSITVRNIVFDELFVAEVITSLGACSFMGFFLGAPVAAVLTSLYLLSAYAAVRDQRICKAAVDEVQPAQRVQDGSQERAISMEEGQQFGGDRESEVSRDTESTSVASFSEESLQRPLQGDPKTVMKLRDKAIGAFGATFKDDMLWRCNVGCTLRVLARSFQLISFVKDIAEKANLTLPLYGTLFMIASAVMRNEFFFFRGNMVEYQTLDAVAAYLIYSRSSEYQAKPFKEWYVTLNWRLQLELISTGVDNFTIEEIIEASKLRIEEMNRSVTLSSTAELDQPSLAPANSSFSASSLFACCRETSSLDQSLLLSNEA